MKPNPTNYIRCKTPQTQKDSNIYIYIYMVKRHKYINGAHELVRVGEIDHPRL